VAWFTDRSIKYITKRKWMSRWLLVIGYIYFSHIDFTRCVWLVIHPRILLDRSWQATACTGVCLIFSTSGGSEVGKWLWWGALIPLPPGTALWVNGSRRVRLTTSLPSVGRSCRKCGNLDVSQPLQASTACCRNSFTFIYISWANMIEDVARSSGKDESLYSFDNTRIA
jgi:hypothetical protein